MSASVVAHAGQVLADVVGLAVDEVPGCLYAGMSLSVEGRLCTVAVTGERARQLDQVQYRHGDGPCLTALRDDEVVLCEDYGHDRRWPAVADAACRLGVGSSLSVPLSVGQSAVGTLNLYAEGNLAFTHRSRVVAQMLARHSMVILDALDRLQRHPDLAGVPALPDAGVAEPADDARRLARQLADAEEASRQLCAQLAEHPRSPAADPVLVGSARHCSLLIEDALLAGAVELATLLGVPDGDLPR